MITQYCGGYKKKMKRFANVMLVLALVLATSVSAVQITDIAKTVVEVNDITVYKGDQVNQVASVVLERGSVAKVEVYFEGVQDAYDSRVEVSIGGYEYGVPRAITPIFAIRDGKTDRKVLALEVPEDIEAGEIYNLKIDIFDGSNRDTVDLNLEIIEKRHAINVFDTIFSPGNRIVKAGQPLFVSVRVENLGEKLEEDIKVIATVPAFGLREESYVNELVTDRFEHDDRDFFHDEEDAASTKDLVFMIPSDVKSGEYEMNVRVEYQRGHAVEEQSYTIRVEGKEQAVFVPVPSETLVVNVDSLTKTVNVGENSIFTFNVANLGQTARVFQVQVTGANGAVRVDPQVITVGKDQTAEAFVAYTATQGQGAQPFMVRFLENGQVVKEVTLTANVQANTGTESNTFKSALEIGFVVLLVILVILALVMVIKRLSEDNTEEPIEGKTYY